MLFILLFFIELLLLFFLSKILTRQLARLFFTLTKSKKVTIYGIALLYLPGTLIHELAHYITALLLFVPAGNMELMPKIEEHGVKLGSVQIARTDPFRRAFIGMAPFLIGTLFIIGIIYAFQLYGGLDNIWLTLVTGYGLFEISNTMFSSKRDMEGTLELLIAILLVSGLLFFLGVRIPDAFLTNFITQETEEIFRIGSLFLAVPLAINIVAITFLKLILQNK